MADKDNIDDKDKDIVRVMKKMQKKPWGGNTVINTVSRPSKSEPKDPAQVIQDLDKEVEEKSKDMPCDIFIERDEWGKVKFILKEKVEKTDKEIYEAVEGTELSEITESTFQEARIVGNVIRNVCLLGKVSKNNRIYSDKAMENVVGLAEGIKCFADHKPKEQMRSVKEIIGAVENAHLMNGKVYGNLKVLSNHKSWVFALAEEMSNQVGMSIIAKGWIASERDDKGREIVESVVALRSIDLVENPATTSGIFEGK